MRRMILVFLALALLCPPAFSAREPDPGGIRYGVLEGMAYYIENGEVTIYDGKPTGPLVDGVREIPAQIEGCPVTQAALRVFSGAETLLIPASVKRLIYLPGEILSFKLLLYFPGSYGEFYCRRSEGASQSIYTYLGIPFADVPKESWYYESVCFARNAGLMNGTGAQTFSPNAAATRAMLATVLWRMAGAPETEAPCPFADVKAGSWYYDAVCWANAAGVSNGVSETAFAPDAPVTREQIAALLMRFAQTQGMAADARAEIVNYPDVQTVSDWAVEAVRWARAAGILKGKLRGGDVYLDPRARARRCEIAEMLMRFCLSAA